jgi:hypothetical protein
MEWSPVSWRFSLVLLHATLGAGWTPAMAAGLTDHAWTVERWRLIVS